MLGSKKTMFLVFKSLVFGLFFCGLAVVSHFGDTDQSPELPPDGLKPSPSACHSVDADFVGTFRPPNSCSGAPLDCP